jgi:hypothetical protein
VRAETGNSYQLGSETVRHADTSGWISVPETDLATVFRMTATTSPALPAQLASWCRIAHWPVSLTPICR